MTVSVSRTRRSYPVFLPDVQRLRGNVTVCTGRDLGDGSPVYRVSYISGGGDIAFTSAPILVEDQAHSAARVLAELFQAKEVKLDS